MPLFFKSTPSVYLSPSPSSVLWHHCVGLDRSCSSCQLRNSRQHENGRRWKCRSAVPEWLLGSRLKAQGEEDDWKKERKTSSIPKASQAGVINPRVLESVCWTETYLLLIKSDWTGVTCIFEHWFRDQSFIGLLCAGVYNSPALTSSLSCGFYSHPQLECELCMDPVWEVKAGPKKLDFELRHVSFSEKETGQMLVLLLNNHIRAAQLWVCFVIECLLRLTLHNLLKRNLFIYSICLCST